MNAQAGPTHQAPLPCTVDFNAENQRNAGSGEGDFGIVMRGLHEVTHTSLLWRHILLACARVARVLVAIVLLLSASLKLLDLLAGKDLPAALLGALILEAVLSAWLLAAKVNARLPLGACALAAGGATLFALSRVLIDSAPLSPCGCLGSRFPLAAWQELVLAGSILAMAGLALLGHTDAFHGVAEVGTPPSRLPTHKHAQSAE